MPKTFVLKWIDLMALHKLNIFHWHLTDDHGWRIEIKKYPDLAKKGSGSDFSVMNPAIKTRSDSIQPGGYYTQADIREIVAYAAERYITVVPEIEMPGHSHSAVEVYPEFGNAVQIRDAGDDVSFLGDPVWDNVFNVAPETIRFLQEVLEEIVKLFPSPFIHVGGDEVWKEPWKRNPRAQARMQELGLKDEDELQSWVIRQMDDYLQAKGRRGDRLGRDSRRGPRAGRDRHVLAGRRGGIAAAKAGHDVVMSPASKPISTTTSRGSDTANPSASAGSRRCGRRTTTSRSRRSSARPKRSTSSAPNSSSGANGCPNNGTSNT